MVVWLNGSMAVWLYGSIILWLYCCLAVRLCGCMAHIHGSRYFKMAITVQGPTILHTATYHTTMLQTEHHCTALVKSGSEMGWIYVSIYVSDSEI